MNNYLKKNNSNIREFFNELIFRPTFDDPPMECNEDAIFLKPFMDMLKAIEINLDTVDIYCVYTRLKIMENSEAISIDLLERELKSIENCGEIMDSLSSNFNYQNDKNKSIDINIEGKLTNSNNNNQNNFNRTNSISQSQANNNNTVTASENINNNLNLNINENLNNEKETESKKNKNEIAVIDDTDSDPVDFDDSDSKIEYESSNDKDGSKIFLVFFF